MVHALLYWIEQTDIARRYTQEKPPFVREDGSAIFPEGEEWWLTELQQRKAPGPQLDLAGGNIAADDLTVSPSEVGSATDEKDADGSKSTASDERVAGYPMYPQALECIHSARCADD